MNKIAILGIFLFASVVAYGQQEATYTYYMNNILAMNPAYAGTSDFMDFTLLHRSQWAGMDGAPTVETFTVHAPIEKYKTGVGLSVANDHIGVTNDFSIYADYSYYINIKGISKLYFGLKGGFDKISDKLTDLVTEESNDWVFESDFESRFMPNFGIGLYYSIHNYYVGASVPRLLHYNLENSEVKTSLMGGKEHYYFTGGAAFDVSSDVRIQPSALVKITKGAPMSLDITAIATIKEMFFGGLMWRTNNAVGVLAGVHLWNQLSIGYAFDWSYAALSRNNGSHEVILSYDLDMKKFSKGLED